MIVTTVEVHVKKDHIDDFIRATSENHRKSVNEPGNLRFDVLQSIDNETRFTLYEAYDSEASVKAHKETDHYKKWRESVEDWMEIPRKGTAHKVIAPAEISSWK